MWAGSTFGQILNICVMFKYLGCGRIVESFGVSSSCTRRTECWWHRANSVITVDTMNCIRRCLRRQGILEWGRVFVILNQNSSADRLGLDPAGLTKWEKHLRKCQKAVA